MEEHERQVLKGSPDGDQKQEARRDRAESMEVQTTHELYRTLHWIEKRSGGHLQQRG